MFDFKEKLNTIVKDIAAEIDGAQQMQDGEQKLEKLLTIRDHVSEKLNRLSRSETRKFMAAGIPDAVGTMLVIISFGALSTMPLVGFGLMLPLVASTMYCFKKSMNEDEATRNRQALTAAINDEVLKVAASQPENCMKWPRFVQAIRGAFNPSAQAGTPTIARASTVPQPQKGPLP